MIRSLLLGFVLIAGLLAIPAATAQTTPVLNLILTPEHPPEHEMKVVPGEHTYMKITVTAETQYFVCAQASELAVDLVFEAFPQWAGSSLLPPSVVLTIPALKPGMDKYVTEPKDTTFDMFWGEDRPKTNAKYTYVIHTNTDGADGCAPSPTPTEATVNVKAYGEDIVELANATSGPGAIDCEANFDEKVCKNTPQTGGGNSPGFDVLLLLVGAVGVLAFRRRK